MKLNSQVIFLIAIVGIIVVGVVGATMLSNGPMKQVDFDGVKVNVPSDSNFIRTNDGFADSKYGISIHIFNDNNSATNFLKTKNGATVVSLKNQPPQSVAFKHADDTNVLVTNGLQFVDIGARDENLVSDMANTVVFANHQKSAKPDPIIPLFTPPPYLEFHRDFYLIMPFIAKLNMNEFNIGIVQNSLNVTINEHNSAIDNNTFNQYSAKEFEQNTGNPLPNTDQQNTSLLDNQNVSNVVNSMGSDNGNSANGGSNPGSSGSGNGANSPVPSISPDANTNNNPDVSGSSASSGSAPSSGGSSSPSSVSAPSSGGNAPSNNQQQKLTDQDVKNVVLTKHPGAQITNIQDSGSVFIVSYKDSSGHSQKVKVDAYTGQIMGSVK